MILKIKHIVVFVTLATLFCCKEPPLALSEIQAKKLPITSELKTLDSIEAFIMPYRKRVNEVLDSALAYAPRVITKEEGEHNTTAGNLMADIILSESGPIFKSRTGNTIDFAVFNYGGIRSIISKGKVSARTAYEVMPFENTIVIVALKGTSVRELISFLIHANRPHPIGGIQIILNPDNSLQSVTIQGIPFDENRTYYVATSSYLVQGGDNMKFFKDGLSYTDTGYRIRNAMIDYFKKTDTIAPIIDDRFIKASGS